MGSWLKQGVTYGYSGPVIEDGRTTVASFLKDHDYTTACIGKWHLGWNWPKSGPEKEDVDFSAPITNGPTGPDFRHDDVLPTLIRKAVEFIDEAAGAEAPFFLYLPLPAPHTPILPTEAFRGKSGLNDYGDFCLQVDDVVGQVAQALDRNGITDQTILIFTSDNGCSPLADYDELAGHGHNPSYIYRGHKADIYEGGHRIPLVVQWPDTIAPGQSSSETTCLTDLLATCAEILGTDLPDNAGEDSISMLPLWDGRTLDRSVRTATVHHSINGSFSIRKGKWKLEMCAGSGGWSPPRPGEECEGLPPIQLYDLESDAGETTNVYDRHPDVVKELEDLLTRYVRDGRSTAGQPQENFGGTGWEQLWWMLNGKSG